MSQIQHHRTFMKSVFATAAMEPSDQSRGMAQPPIQLPNEPDAPVVPLPQVSPEIIKEPDL